MYTKIKKNLPKIVALLLFLALSVWWIVLSIVNPESDSPRLFFGATYGLMALFGGLYGLFTARKWGLFKSALGRTVLFLSIGLLLAEFGQIVFSYYNIIKDVEIPYPSLADLGFFGNIPFYILAALSLAKVTGVKLSIKNSPWRLIVGILIPMCILVASYRFFLNGYEFADTSKLTVLLDFGYPLGQAVYVSLALVILLSVGRLLGGVLRKPLLLLLAAFILQYTADFNFLYQTLHETWTNGGYGDYLYLLAYFAVTMSLISLSSAFKSLQSGATKGSQDRTAETDGAQ